MLSSVHNAEFIDWITEEGSRPQQVYKKILKAASITRIAHYFVYFHAYKLTMAIVHTLVVGDLAK